LRGSLLLRSLLACPVRHSGRRGCCGRIACCSSCPAACRFRFLFVLFLQSAAEKSFLWFLFFYFIFFVKEIIVIIVIIIHFYRVKKLIQNIHFLYSPKFVIALSHNYARQK